MSKEFKNRHDRDELDIESLIHSLRQESVTPPPQVQPEEEEPSEPELVREPVVDEPENSVVEELKRLKFSSAEEETQVPYEEEEEDEGPEYALWPEREPVYEQPVPEEEGEMRLEEPEEETDCLPAQEPVPEAEEERPRRWTDNILSFFHRKKKKEAPVYQETPQEEEEFGEQPSDSYYEQSEELPEEPEYVPVPEGEPEPDYEPGDFVPLREEAPDIVLQRMQEVQVELDEKKQEEERKANFLRELQSGQVVTLNLRRREQREESAPEQPAPKAEQHEPEETQRIRLDPRQVMEETRVMPPEPIRPEEKEVVDVPVEPEAPGPRIFTLNLKNRALDNTQTRTEVFDQANEEDDAELETLERMLAKHAEESRRRREAEAERRRAQEEAARKAREAEEEAQRQAEEAEAARLAAAAEGEALEAEEELGETKKIDTDQLRKLAEQQASGAEAEESEEEAPLVEEVPLDEEQRSGLISKLIDLREQKDPVGAREAKEEEEEAYDESEPTSAYDENGELIDESLLQGEQKGAGFLKKMATGLLGFGKKRGGSDDASDAEFEEVGDAGLLGRFKKDKKAAAEDDDVIQMPVDNPNALQKKLEEMNERADEFAESMFQSDSAESKSAEEAHRLAEQYIPATDFEESPAKERGKAKEPKAPERRAPDTSPKELYRIYHSSWKSSLARLPVQLIMAVLLLAFTAVAGGELSFVTVEALTSNPQIAGVVLTIGLCVAVALGLDTLLEGVIQLLRRRPGLNTLASFGVIFTLIDSLWYCLAGREGPLPFCGFAALSLWAVAWGNCSKKDGLQRASGAVAGRSEFERLTMDQGKWDRWGTFTKEPGSTKGFGSQMQEEDGAQQVYRYAAPVMLIACIMFGILSVVGQKDPSMLIWSWSVIFVLATPLSATLAYGMPYLVSTRRLLRNGAVLAGWEGVESMKGEAGIVLKDRDLFPEGAVTFNGIQNFGSVSLEKLTGCTASMIREADVGLAKIFDDQIRIQGGFYRRVDELQYSDAGGFSGLIRGDKVLIGTAGFMKMQGIELEQGQHVKNAVFCVINGQLQGIFALNYTLPRNVEPNLDALINGRVYPVLALRDFNITPGMLQQRFRLPVERMQYPPVDKRHQLSARNQPHNPVLGALVFREGIGPYMDAILGGRRLRSVVRLNTILSILASAVGAFLGFYLTLVSAYASLSPMNILFFLLMWLVPIVLISHAADKF